MKVYTHDVRAKVQAERDETEAKAERWECDELDRMIEEAKADILGRNASRLLRLSEAPSAGLA